MATRRDFLKLVAAGGGAAVFVHPIRALPSRRQASTGYFGLHPFIESHPEAVFIMKTSVDQKMNAEANLQAGTAFGRSVFVPRDSSGVPVNISIPVKPNFKTASPTSYKLEEIIGHVPNPYFIEGMFGAMKELGIQGKQFHLREVNRPAAWTGYGIVDMCNRAGLDLRLDLDPTVTSLQAGRDYNWIDVPNGVFWKRIPYLEPINTPDTWMLGIAKFKAHNMGMTLCCKNLQGSIAHNYQQLCAAWGSAMSINPAERHANAYDIIKQSYDRHRASGSIPRWDRPGTDSISSLGQETWAARTLDNISATPCQLHIIEGIYGRDGQGDGVNGPNPQDQNHVVDAYGRTSTGKAWDWMSNIIIFGKNIFRTDLVGFYLGGHEPGNFGFFHCAIDRGMSDVLDPRKIPLYLWEDGKVTLIRLEDLPRTPLLSHYLTKDYNGQTEKPFHLINEPYDYSKVPLKVQDRGESPRSFVLHQNYPNPFNPYTSIEYVVPKESPVKLEVYNASGQLVEVLVDGYRAPGSHMAVWNAYDRASGTYFYRFRCGGFTETRKMVLLK